MSDRYLVRYFLAVIDQGNFSKAAAHCRVSQPTLSAGIAKLERLLDKMLFTRTSRRVELTAAGARFAASARRIEAEFLQAELDVMEQRPIRLVRLGIASTLPANWVQTAAQHARAAASEEQLEFIEGTARELGVRLDRGRLDAVIAPIIGEAQSGEALFEEGYRVAMAQSHPLASRSEVAAEELASDVMIVRRSCEALPIVSRHFTQRGIRPFMAARSTNDEWVLAYVRAGLGITVMPRCFQSDEIAMPALTGFNAIRTIRILTGSDHGARARASKSVAAFRRSLVEAAGGSPGAR